VYTEIISSEQEVASAMPSNFDMGRLSQAFTNPTEIFRILDKNGDGRVTKLAKFIFKKLDADGNGSLEPSDLTHANGILSSILKMKKKAVVTLNFSCIYIDPNYFFINKIIENIIIPGISTQAKYTANTI
jgi:hypothetical protein